MSSLTRCTQAGRFGWMAAAILALGAGTASADTRIMPTRQALKGVNVVVWGNTSQINGTAYTLDCGPGALVGPISGNVTDRSYIQRTCNYPIAASYTATLTVGAEAATATIAVVDPAVATPLDLRGTKINMAIEDGLRYLYQSQANRATAFLTNQTTWNSYTTSNNPNAFAALALVAIQNHGHAVNGPATDIFQPVVQRGLNYIFDRLIQRDMNPCDEDPGPGVSNPCINVPLPVNIGLSATNDFYDGYTTPILAAAIAAATSAAPARTVDAGLGAQNGNFVVGKTYTEILQRVVNAIAWGQSDSGLGKGGWYYNLQAGSSSDGSTMGWSLLGLIDSQAAGATIPPFAKTNFSLVLANQLNNDGTIDYQVDGNPNSTFTGSMTKVGIALQGLAFSGVAAGDARVTNSKNYIVTNWNSQVSNDDNFECQTGTPTTTNKGCGYAMFNIFKGLKSYGITTLAGIGRPAGPAPIAADDWYADYVDNLLANQHAPTDPARGEWAQYDEFFNIASPPMGWSCCEYNTIGITAMAELILAPVAFVLPDPILFSTVGLSPASATNPVGTDHTVTAFAQSSNNQPVPGATISFSILAGSQNAGVTGTCNPAGCVTGQDGKVNFTYHDNNGAGTDTIQAFIGQQGSNQVTKTWTSNVSERCDADGDGDVDSTDLNIIRAANGQLASSASDPRDGNGDGRINVADVRYCQLHQHAKPE
jgi:hypothetical protein